MIRTATPGTKLTATDRRTLRRLRSLLAEQFVPPICKKIRGTRMRLRQEALDRGEKEAAREFTQERLAAKLHLTTKAYRAYETDREPGYLRRQEIARTLGLDPDYFEVAQSVDRDEEIQSLREELAGTRGEVAGLREDMSDLRRELSQSGQQSQRGGRRRAN